MIRQGIRGLVETESAPQAVAEAGNGLETLYPIRTHRPVVAVLDIQMRVNWVWRWRAQSGTSACRSAC